MHNHEPSIKCPTYLKIEPEIQKLTESINQAKDVQEKAALALELQKEVKVLLECPDYKSATSAPRQTEGPSGHLPLGGDVRMKEALEAIQWSQHPQGGEQTKNMVQAQAG